MSLGKKLHYSFLLTAVTGPNKRHNAFRQHETIQCLVSTTHHTKFIREIRDGRRQNPIDATIINNKTCQEHNHVNACQYESNIRLSGNHAYRAYITNYTPLGRKVLPNMIR
jgi:hypothetical protein